MSIEGRERRNQDARIRYQRAVVALPRPLRKVVAVRGKRRRENMPQQRILDALPLLVGKFLVKPIIGEGDGYSDLGTIEEGLDNRPGFPARLSTQARQCGARGAQRIGFRFAVADQRQKGRMYQAAALALDPGAHL